MMARRVAAMLALAAAFAGAWMTAAAAGPPVRIEVDARATVAPAPPRVFGFSGNIWGVPQVFDAGVSDRILAQGRLGITRVSLGDSIIEPSTDLQDIRRRLEAFPLNDFLRRYKAAGGRVLLILDGTPRWLSSNRDTTKVKGPDQPRFRVSPPTDLRAWSDVVEALVRHFNGKLGLDAYYEAWNEPNFYYYGTADQFMRQYYHSVLGARRADPHALIGGAGISEFLGGGTAAETRANEAEKVRIATLALEQRFFWREFLERAAKTPVPELRLARLPVDFFSWHAFYFDPARYYGIVVPYVRDALAKAGYPASTPLINTEWNIAPVPPYPEGDLNATHVDAAYAAASLIAMNEAGVDGQAFQMYVDPGGEGYYGGMFFVTGVARATFHAFTLFAKLRGRQVRATTSDPWVKATAFVDGPTTYVLVASYVPTPKMIAETQSIADFLENAEFARDVVRGGTVKSLLAGRGLPEAQARRAREIEERKRERIQAAVGEASHRGRDLTLEIALSGAGTPRSVTRLRIDSRHGNVFPEIGKVHRDLQARGAPDGGQEAHYSRALESAGLGQDESRAVLRALRAGPQGERALSSLPAAKREAVARALRDARQQLANRHRAALAEVEASTPSAHVDETSLEWPASGSMRVEIESQSVQLFVVNR
ncbi:MAG: GH39 family glycosyl hydrolase [Betaproteobacteria bacterium]